ncbi:hypothetical protein EJ110_NYTH31545 [Nymphaea thermarum]|nr:hypothetical protein EJ110_NYTH31545 [Nymphaea thermarum]
MGNCQAAEAATVVIEHPGGKVERIYWSLSATEIMKANPGHYVALIIASIPSNKNGGPSIKQLKLLRPDDTLHIGHVYRLVSFEEVLKEFSGRKYAKLSRMMSLQKQRERPESRESVPSRRQPTVEKPVNQVETDGVRAGRGRFVGRQGQWRPALQSIDELGR